MGHLEYLDHFGSQYATRDTYFDFIQNLSKSSSLEAFLPAAAGTYRHSGHPSSTAKVVGGWVGQPRFWNQQGMLKLQHILAYLPMISLDTWYPLHVKWWVMYFFHFFPACNCHSTAIDHWWPQAKFNQRQRSALIKEALWWHGMTRSCHGWSHYIATRYEKTSERCERTSRNLWSEILYVIHWWYRGKVG